MSGAALFPVEEYAGRPARLPAEMRARDAAALIADECQMLHGFNETVLVTEYGPERPAQLERMLFVR